MIKENELEQMELTSSWQQEKPREDEQVLPAMRPIDAHQLAEARREASDRGVSVFSVLEEMCGGRPDHLVAELGRLLRMPVLTMESLRSAIPAFELLTYNEAVTRECALLRQDENYILAVGNPFSPNLRAWAQECIDVAAMWHLVHPADLAAFFCTARADNARDG